MFMVYSGGSCVTRLLGQSTWEVSDSPEVPKIARGCLQLPDICTIQQWARRAIAFLGLGRPGSESYYRDQVSYCGIGKYRLGGLAVPPVT